MDKNRQIFFVTFVTVFLLSLPSCAANGPPAQLEPNPQPSQTSLPGSDNVIEIETWAYVDEQVQRGRIDGVVEAAKRVTDFNIISTGVSYSDGNRFIEEFVVAAESGQAPDIVHIGSFELRAWSEAGYFIPFDKCRATYSEFDDVLDHLWPLATWQGQVWGVPHYFDAYPLFFNKVKLRELGWSDEDINALPERIQRGEFTLDDMIKTAEAALDEGVIEPGFGFWPRPRKDARILQVYVSYGRRIFDPAQDKLVINKKALEHWYAFQRELVEKELTPENLLDKEWNMGIAGRSVYHDTVAHGRVLFWIGGTWYWSFWATQYTPDLGGRDHLNGFVGYALMPSAVKGQPGTTDVGLGFYTITSEQASGRKNQAVACAILAQATTPYINTLHAVEDSRLGVLKSQANYGPYTQHPLLADTRYMLDYGWLPTISREKKGIYFDILWQFMLKAENGEMLPAEAAETAVEQLQRDLGKAIIVEEE